jgi:hypothetical protein
MQRLLPSPMRPARRCRPTCAALWERSVAFPRTSSAASDGVFRAAMLARFAGGATDDPRRSHRSLRASALATYRAYWRTALADPAGRVSAEASLLAALHRLTGREDIPDLDAMEPIVRKRLEDAGCHSLQGQTGALRELMLWTRQETRSYDVALPDGEHTTRVFVLDGFGSLGWGDYATCGRRGTGGWATADALYAVAPRYASLDGEEFRLRFSVTRRSTSPISRAFRQCRSGSSSTVRSSSSSRWRTPLAIACSASFQEDQGDDPASPHAYANKRVLAALERRLALRAGADLAQVERGTLNAAAAEELRDDTPPARATSGTRLQTPAR